MLLRYISVLFLALKARLGINSTTAISEPHITVYLLIITLRTKAKVRFVYNLHAPYREDRHIAEKNKNKPDQGAFRCGVGLNVLSDTG